MKRIFMLSIFSVISGFFLRGQGVDVKTLPPLDELGTGTFEGKQGGLYPNGSNSMPKAFYDDAVAMANSIQPLNAEGKPDPNGKIGLVTIGASTVAMFSKGLEDMVPQYKGVNKELTFVNCGIGGQDLSDIMEPTANYWKVIDARLKESGLSFDQVQVIWFQEDNLRNRENGVEARGKQLVDDFAYMVRFCKKHYPNLKLFYVTGRHTTEFMPPEGKDKHREPKAYINGWACKWLIEKQINGDKDLAYKGENAVAPLVLWGPYFWTQGDKPRADGYTWNKQLVSNDGVHPTDAGIQRVSKDLVDFWSTDPVSQLWFLENPAGAKPVAEEDYMHVMINKTVVENIMYSNIGERFRIAVVKDSVVVFKDDKAKRSENFNVEIKEPGEYKFVINDEADHAIAGKFIIDEDMDVKVPAETTESASTEVKPGKVIDPNAPAWVVNGTNKLPKLERIMRGHDTVKAVVLDGSGKVLLEIEDVLNKHTDLNELLERGEYAMKFYDADGTEIPLPEEFNSSVRIKY
ncbi:MAG: hypothetical protein WAT43_05250 [Chitinophagales bacterium]